MNMLMLVCMVWAMVTVSALPVRNFRGGAGKFAIDMFRKVLPSGFIRRISRNPIIPWMNGFIQKSISAVRRRKMMKTRGPFVADLQLGGLTGLMAMSSEGSTGVAVTSNAGRGFVMAVDGQTGGYVAGSYGGESDVHDQQVT